MITYSEQTHSNLIDWKTKRFPVYRILDNKKWMDNFFSTGEIQLSCFKTFKTYKDEMQGDEKEGDFALDFHTDGYVNFLMYESGLNAYILSTTQNLNKKVISDFRGECAIKINHPTYFALEIAKKLPFVSSGLEGSCDYVNSKLAFIKNQPHSDLLEKALEDKNNPQLKELIAELTSGMELFMKNTKYSHQEEYRFVWFSSNPINSTILINCPEAARYCEPIFLNNEES